jgi:hypothetical protein
MDEALVEGWRLKPIHIRVVRKWGYSDAYLENIKSSTTKEDRKALEMPTMSELTIDNDDFKAYVLEREGPSTIIENQMKRVPSGIYNLIWGKWFHQKDNIDRHVVRLHNDKVAAYRGILIHIGNNVGNSTGCLLMGLTKNSNISIGESTAALTAFVDKLKDITKTKEIVEDKPILGLKLIITEDFEK